MLVLGDQENLTKEQKAVVGLLLFGLFLEFFDLIQAHVLLMTKTAAHNLARKSHNAILQILNLCSLKVLLRLKKTSYKKL